MIKAIVVRNNKVVRIVVAKSLEAVKLHGGESIHEIKSGEFFKPGDKHKGIFSRFADMFRK